MFNDEVYSTLVYYLQERETIRTLKESGESKPWTDDVILQNYKFTNVLRRDDKTSRWFIDNWYQPNYDAPAEDVLLNAIYARYFGTITFGKLMGWSTYADYDVDELYKKVEGFLEEGHSIFTGAYVITNGGIKAPKYEVVIKHYIDGIYDEIPEIVKVFDKNRSWEEAAKFMMQFNGFGGTGFMVKEVLSDCQYTAWMNNPVDKYTWTPMGPGAIRGLNRVMGRNLNSSIREPIPIMLKLYHRLLGDLNPNLIQGEPDGPWDLHGLQFALCELDKYLRVKTGEGKPRSRYKGV